MRLNQFVARATGLSRRAADSAISSGRIKVNGLRADIGQTINAADTVELDGERITAGASRTIMLNKPAGYVCSRNGQGSKTIYDLLPEELRGLKPVGRLDKDSSGLLLLTDDGQLAYELTHPKFQKQKAYQVVLDKSLLASDERKINQGVEVDDYVSRLRLKKLATSGAKTAEAPIPDSYFLVTLTEGRNRQIRRTFARLGYEVVKLHRISFGRFRIGDLRPGSWQNAS